MRSIVCLMRPSLVPEACEIRPVLPRVVTSRLVRVLCVSSAIVLLLLVELCRVFIIVRLNSVRIDVFVSHVLLGSLFVVRAPHCRS